MTIMSCPLPPPGWHCTRPYPHENPCAAVPDEVPVTDDMIAQVEPYTQDRRVEHRRRFDDLTMAVRRMQTLKHDTMLVAGSLNPETRLEALAEARGIQMCLDILSCTRRRS
jgi:hypothetical protein